MGGSAFPKQLFEKTSVAASTGFRNAMILQNRYLIKKVGGKYDIRYKITHWGKQLLEGTLQKNFDTPFHQYADQDEGKKAWEPYDNLKE